MANPFDQFDEQVASNSKTNPFDQFDQGGNEASPAKEEPGFLSNALSGAADRAMELGGNLLQAHANAAEWREEATKDIPVLGTVVDYLNPDALTKGARSAGQSLEDADAEYQQRYSWDLVKESPTPENIAGFIGEQGIRSVPDMVAAVSALPAYVVTRAQEIAEERAKNNGKTLEDGTLSVEEYAPGVPVALGVALLERFGAKGMLGIGEKPARALREVPGAVAGAASREAGTEGLQEMAEYAGATVATEKGFDGREAVDRGLAGAVAGGGMGGTVRAGTASIEVARGDRGPDSLEQPAPESQTAEQAPDANPDPAIYQNPNASQADWRQAWAQFDEQKDLLDTPRSALSAEERQRQDDLAFGDSYAALLGEAEARGNQEAATKLQEASRLYGDAVEADTLAGTSNDAAAAEQAQGLFRQAASLYRDGVASLDREPDPSMANEQRQEARAQRKQATIATAQAQAASAGGDALQQAMAGQQAEQMADTVTAQEKAIEAPSQRARVGQRVMAARQRADALAGAGLSGRQASSQRNYEAVVRQAERHFEQGNIDAAERVLARGDSIASFLQSASARTPQPEPADTGSQARVEPTLAIPQNQSLDPAAQTAGQAVPATALDAVGQADPAATSQAPVTSQAAPEAAPQAPALSTPEVRLMSRGRPFSNQRSAEVSGVYQQARRSGMPVRAVEVPGGWGVEVGQAVSPQTEADVTPGSETGQRSVDDVEQSVPVMAETEPADAETRPASDESSVAMDDEQTTASYKLGDGQDTANIPTAEGVRNALAGMEDQLGDFTVIDHPRELPPPAIMAMTFQGVSPQSVRGMFWEDRLFIIAGNNESIDQAVRTAIHEAVGHKGMRGVLGDELVPVMRQLYKTLPLDPRGREALDEVLESYSFLDPSNVDDQVTIAEEMVAHLIERGYRPKVWQRAVAKIRELLRRLFPNMRWTVQDVVQLGEKSRDYLRQQQAQREAEGGPSDQLYSIAATADDAPSAREDGYSDSDSAGFALPDETLTQAALRKMQDKMGRLKQVVRAIEQAGGKVSDENNAYLAEELFHGKIENDLRRLRETFVEPLAEKLAAYDITQDQLDEYLIARHAPERNAVIAQRNEQMPDGGSGMTNAEARQVLDSVAASGKKAQYDEAASLVYGMLRERREAMRQGGLATEEALSDWEATYQNYVPLKGNPVKGAAKGNRGKGYNVAGKETKMAGGRRSRADSPSSQSIIDATESLIRRRKNEVGNALLSLAADNPNPDVWEVFTEDNPDMERKAVRVSDGEGGTKIEVRDQPVPMHMSEEYFATKRAGKTYYLKIKDPLLMRAMKNLGPENNNALIRTMGAGVRFMSAMNTSYNPEFMLSNFARDVQTAILNLNAEQSRDDGKAKGQRIAASTAKDVPAAMRAVHASLRGKGLEGKGAEWQRYFDEFRKDGAKTGWYDQKDIEGQAKEIRRLMLTASNSKPGMLLRNTKAVAKFVDDANSAVENAVRLSAYVNARRAGISRAKAASLAKNMTVNFNRRGEVGTALNAFFMFANASIQGSANFARTMIGLKSPEVASGWDRLNTAQKLAVGMAAGAYSLAMLNRWASEEDDDGVLFWDKIPSYIKERNIVIMASLWGGDPEDYVKIPMPYGYNIFGVMGTQAEAVINGDESAGKAASNLALATLGSFSPIGYEDADGVLSLVGKNLTPSLVRPIAQIMDNSDFAGRMIYRENPPYGTPKPESSLGFRSTPEAYKKLSSFLNEVTGGSEFRSGEIDINPDVMQHIVNFYGGGAWSFGDRVVNFAQKKTGGEEVEKRQIPFAGRFQGEVTAYPDQGLFYERLNELSQFDAEFEAVPAEEARRYYQEHEAQIRLYGLAKNVETDLRALRRAKDAVEQAPGFSDSERKARVEQFEKEMKRTVDNFNKTYNQME